MKRSIWFGHSLTGCILFSAVTLASSVEAASISWGTPTNIVGDTDVSMTGAAVYAYAWSGTSQTLNGVLFTGTTNSTSGGADVALTNFGYNTPTAFTSSSNPFNSLSAGYKNILTGADFNIFGDNATVTLQNLTVGLSYQIQVWVSDPRPVAGRYGTIEGGNVVMMLYSANNTAGSPGQYSIGTFTADSTSQGFTMSSNGSTQINALQLRSLPPPPPITWGAATTITGDSDVSTAGTLQYAYNWNGSTQTVNGQTFTGSNSSSGGGTNVSISASGLTNNGNSTFATSSAPFVNLSTAYKSMLGGADDTATAVPMIVTLKALSVGHTYGVQVWVQDSRSGFQNRNDTLTTTGNSSGNSVTLNFTNSNANGGLGQHTIGTFTALYQTQAFTVTGSVGTSQINALQLRDISPPTPFNITAMTPAPDSIQTTTASSIVLTLSANVDPSTVNANNIKLKRAGQDGLLDTADDVAITPTAISVVNGNQIKIDQAGQANPSEKYRITLLGTSQTQAVTGMAAYFRLDELTGTAVADSSGNANSGTLTGNQGWTPGKVGGALGLNTSSYVTVNNTVLGNFGTGDFSVAFWVKTQTQNCLLIGNRYSNGHGPFWTVKVATQGPAASFEVDQDGGGTNYNNVLGTKTISDGLWHHVAVVRSGAVQKVYTDGVLDGNGTGLGAANVSSGGATIIGTDVNITESSRFVGTMDEVYIFNRAITLAEVQTLSGTASPIASQTGAILDGEYPGTGGGFPSGNGTPGGDFTATFQVNLFSTTTLVSAPQPITYGTTSVALNGNVNGGPVQNINSGTVTFQLMNEAVNVSAAVTGNVTLSTANVTYPIPTGTPIGTYTVVATYNGGGLYTTSTDSSQKLTINKAPLSVTANNFSRAYGSANPNLTGTISGIQYNDAITATYATSAGLTSTIGAYSIVPTLVDPTSKLANYTVTSNNGALTVTTAPLTVTGANGTRVYGAADPAFSGTITGIKNNDNITATYATSATVLSAAGTYPIVPTLVDPNNKLSNYSVVSTTGTLTVTKAPLTAVAFNSTRTYGAANPLFSGILSGVLNGDNILATYDTSANPASPVGIYAIVPQLIDPDGKAGNYSASLSNGALTVTKAALTVTPADASRPYGAPNPAFSGTITGIQNNDNITATYATSAGPSSAVGTYAISATLVDPNNRLGNYTVTPGVGTLSINKASPAIVWPPPARIVAGNPLTAAQLNAAAQDAFSAAPLAGTFEYTPGDGTLLSAGLGQVLSVTFTPADAANYIAAAAQTTIDIDPAIPPTITSALSASVARDAAFSYTLTADGTAPIAFNATGLPPGLSFAGTDITGTPSAAGVFNIALSATNFGGSDTKNLKLTVLGSGTNHAPAITSPPTPSANPALTGTPVAFAAQATDDDGDALDYVWDFGDGTTGLGASVSKTYAAPGVYIVTLTVSDGQASATQSLNLVVNEQAVVGTFAVDKVKLSFNFAKPGKDSLNLTGRVTLPTGFIPANKSVRILIRLLDVQTTLTSKGRSTDRSFTLIGKRGSDTAKFTFVLKNQDLFAKLQGLGFSKTQSNPGVSMPVIVVLDGQSYLDQPAISYTTNSNKAGPSSGKGKK